MRDRDGEVAAVRQPVYFTVPADIPAERVEAKFPEYIRKAGNELERRGFRVLAVSTPEPDPHSDAFGTEPDRRRYRMFALVRRRPQEVKLWVPDNAVSRMQELGMRLNE